MSFPEIFIVVGLSSILCHDELDYAADVRDATGERWSLRQKFCSKEKRVVTIAYATLL